MTELIKRYDMFTDRRNASDFSQAYLWLFFVTTFLFTSLTRALIWQLSIYERLNDTITVEPEAVQMDAK